MTQTLPASSSSRLDGLMSRCRTPWLAGVGQGVGHLHADAGHALPVRSARLAQRGLPRTGPASGDRRVGRRAEGVSPLFGHGNRGLTPPLAGPTLKCPDSSDWATSTADTSFAAVRCGLAALPCSTRRRFGPSQSPQLGEHFIEAQAVDELHDIVVQAVLLRRHRRPAQCWCGAAGPPPAPRAGNAAGAAGRAARAAAAP